MQISALEVAKLLTIEGVGPAGKAKTKLEFVDVTPDSLPETVKPDPAEVARVVEMVNSAPGTREDIVMELKERIEKGEYEVSGDEIAEMIVRRIKADMVR